MKVILIFRRNFFQHEEFPQYCREILDNLKTHLPDMDMFKKHRQGCEHPKNAQFDIYAKTSNFFNKFRWNLQKKLIIMSKIWPQNFFSWKSKLLKRIDIKVTLLLRYQLSCFIKGFSYSETRILFFVNIWSQKWHQTREVTLFQERYRIAK